MSFLLHTNNNNLLKQMKMKIDNVLDKFIAPGFTYFTKYKKLEDCEVINF